MATVGRPPRFDSPDAMWQAFEAWRDEFKIGGLLFNEYPDIEGFCHYIGSYRELLMEYERKPDFSRTVKEIKNWIYYRKKQSAAQGKYPVALFIFDAKNNAGYVEKVETDITSGGEKVTFANTVPRPSKDA